MRKNAKPEHPLTVVNPLPRALQHFEKALAATIDKNLAVEFVRPDFEIGHLRRVARVKATLRALHSTLRVALRRGPVLVLWPTFGLAEAFLWSLAPGAGTRTIIFHDPVPLRRQAGFSPIAKVLGRWGAQRRRVRIMTHTRLAADAMAAYGMPVDSVVPHPVLPTARRERERPRTTAAIVAGQFKDARDTELLERIARSAPANWSLIIRGRNWPLVQGWDVQSQFLSEDELDETIRSASAIVLPYDHYFQSGIATRAFELGVPVVGHRHEYLESLYGIDWPGLIAPASDGWIAAIGQVAPLEVPDAHEYLVQCRSQWRKELSIAAAVT